MSDETDKPASSEPAATPAPTAAPSKKRTPTRVRATVMDRILSGPAAAVLAIVLFVMVNYLSARHYRRFDWTRHSLFTLSPRSREIVRSLSAPTDLYVLLGQREPQFSDVSELAQRYVAENQRLRVHTIDPDRQRDRFLELVRRLGLRVGRVNGSDVASEAAVVVARGDRHFEVPREALAGLADTTDPEGNQGQAAQVTVERAMTEALLRVENNESTRVCVATGHGEVALTGGDDSMSMLATELRHGNTNTQAVDLRGNATIPPDCDALLIAGPRQSFSASEAAVIERYLRQGGNALLLLDPLFVDARHAPTGLEGIARLGGIELTNTVVLETDGAHQMAEMLPTTFLATEFGEHEVTRGLRGIDARVLVSTSRALRRLEGTSVVPQSLLRTTPGAWGETSTGNTNADGQLTRDPTDIGGPIHLAMSAQIPDVQRPARARARDAAGRLLVIGYSHLVTNEAMAVGFRARFANNYFIEAAIGWLTARRELIEIPARPASPAALLVSRQDIRNIRIYTVLLVPLAAALVGIAVWRARKAQ